MLKLDDKFLEDIGLGSLSKKHKSQMLQDILETLQKRVGERLAERMTDAQIDEFVSIIDKSDDSLALKWLESNFPNYKEVVKKEMDTLKEEVRQSADQIVQVLNSQNEQ